VISLLSSEESFVSNRMHSHGFQPWSLVFCRELYFCISRGVIHQCFTRARKCGPAWDDASQSDGCSLISIFIELSAVFFRCIIRNLHVLQEHGKCLRTITPGTSTRNNANQQFSAPPYVLSKSLTLIPPLALMLP
jgi:hypothetical protein